MLCRHGGVLWRATRWHDTVFGVWGLFAYHYVLALPLGLATGNNLNYMLCPTSGLQALADAVVPAALHWPSYHTPIGWGVAILGQALAVVYLVLAAAVVCARDALAGTPNNKKKN